MRNGVVGHVRQLLPYAAGASENVANFGLSTYVLSRPREWLVSVRRNF